MKREYIAIIHKEKHSNYGISFPDFKGCISAGKTMEEAKEMAKEALQFHIDSILEDGEELPNPSTLDQIKIKYKAAETFLIVPVSVNSKAVRINMTIDEFLLRRLDKFVEKIGENRSSFIQKMIRDNCKEA